VEENEIILRLENDSSEEGDKLLLGLLTHLYFLAEEFQAGSKSRSEITDRTDYILWRCNLDD